MCLSPDTKQASHLAININKKMILRVKSLTRIGTNVFRQTLLHVKPASHENNLPQRTAMHGGLLSKILPCAEISYFTLQGRETKIYRVYI